MKTKRTAVLIRLETIEGTDASPAEADAIPLASVPRFTVGAEYENLNADAHFGGLGRIGQLEPAGEFGELQFDVWLRGRTSGALLATNKPEADALLQIGGAGVTVVNTPGNESVRYRYGLSTGEKSATVYYHEDGVRHVLVGCRANLSFLFEAGRPVKCTATIRGLRTAFGDAPFPTLTYTHDPKPPIVRNSAFALGGWAAIWSRLQVDINAQLARRDGPNEADALLPYIIGDYDPTMGLDPEIVSTATFDIRQQWRSAAGLAMSFGPIGTAAGNRIAASAPRTQLRAPGHGERELYKTYDLTCGLHVSTGDDFFDITFT